MSCIVDAVTLAFFWAVIDNFRQGQDLLVRQFIMYGCRIPMKVLSSMYSKPIVHGRRVLQSNDAIGFFVPPQPDATTAGPPQVGGAETGRTNQECKEYESEPVEGVVGIVAIVVSATVRIVVDIVSDPCRWTKSIGKYLFHDHGQMPLSTVFITGVVLIVVVEYIAVGIGKFWTGVGGGREPIDAAEQGRARSSTHRDENLRGNERAKEMDQQS